MKPGAKISRKRIAGSEEATQRFSKKNQPITINPNMRSQIRLKSGSFDKISPKKAKPQIIFRMWNLWDFLLIQLLICKINQIIINREIKMIMPLYLTSNKIRIQNKILKYCLEFLNKIKITLIKKHAIVRNKKRCNNSIIILLVDNANKKLLRIITFPQIKISKSQ